MQRHSKNTPVNESKKNYKYKLRSNCLQLNFNKIL